MSEESKITRVGKWVLFCGIVLMLFLPLIQTFTHFKKHIYPLDGAFYPESDIDFTWDHWFGGAYGEQKDKYLRENFGLRNYYVRLICQVNFNLFKKSNVAYVVVGKDNYLYETAYIDAYYGRDFIGQEKIDGYIKKLKAVQDTMAKLNKLLLVTLAPGKACFYPEFIPDNYKTPKAKTNYEGFIQAMKTQGLNHIDFYKHYTDQRSKSPYPLYPQLGIHWSDYASILAMDSINRYTEHKLGVNLPDLKFKNIEYVEKVRGVDDDAIKSLNLFIEPKTFKMAYPNWEVVYDSTRHKKLNLLVVSDSFWWYIYSTTIPDKTFASSRFWYYNEEMYPESFTSPLRVSQVEYASKIRDADVIVLMHAEATMYKFGGGFVDLCHESYFEAGSRKEKIRSIKEKIRKVPAQLEAVNQKAREMNIPEDSMLTNEAILLLEKEGK